VRIVGARMEQLALKGTAGHGGARANAGRKPPKKGARGRVRHEIRPVHAARHPVHVTLRARGGLPSFRSQIVLAMFERLVAELAAKEFKIVHFSLQTNHVHAIVEGADKRTLSAGMRRLVIRFAKRLIAMLGGRAEKVWDDRYHAHVLKTPRETRHALVYVLQNVKKHGAAAKARFIDPFSSGNAFDGWVDAAPARAPPAVGTWMLRVGWRLHGLIATTDAPRSLRV
jgi:putative transposase